MRPMMSAGGFLLQIVNPHDNNLGLRILIFIQTISI